MPRLESNPDVPHPSVFATTDWSAVAHAGESPSPEAAAALEKLCRAYWYPLYLYARRRSHDPADAQDLTQGFFAHFLEHRRFAKADRQRGKFRTFLLCSFQHFITDEWKRAQAEKRGHGLRFVSFDGLDPEERYQLEPAYDADPERAYDRRWALTLLEQSMTRLRAEHVSAGKAGQFDQLKGFLVVSNSEGGYDAVAGLLGMNSAAVATAVHRMRHRYAELVRAEVANTVATPSEVEDEMRYLFGG